MKKRITAFILSLVFLIPIISTRMIPDADAAEKSIYILHNGSRISEIEIQQNEKEILKADISGIEVFTYQWQILIDVRNSVWVNIYDKTERDCEISYPLFMNLLDDANSAYIRCAASNDSETVYSEAVCVTVYPSYEIGGRTAFFSETAKPARYAAARAEETEFVVITIRYLDISSLNGQDSQIYSPYTARIEAGSDFKQSIVSPTFLGFAPYYDKNGGNNIEDDASNVRLELENVTEDVLINVYYKPIEVNFAIRYFFQNVNDDLYTENAALYHSGKAKTGSIIEDEYLQRYAGDTQGFQKMYHVPESVAADGSTVFECYYDRNYYLIQFDLDGGYGTDPIYARYGTPYLVNEPTKNGYTFAGWDRLIVDTSGNGIVDEGDGKADELSPVVGTEHKDVLYKALWKSSDTTYYAAYWVMKDNGEREYLGRIRTNAKSGDVISAKDDIKTKYKEIFAFDEHEHSYASGCYNNCTSAYPQWHTHTADCLSCQKLEHKHTDACNPDPRYYEYDETLSSKNVVIEGDGSSTVNVYYRPKEYTLRFYYARESTANGFEIVGGSTYAFGGYNNQTVAANFTVEELLAEVPANQWGKAEKPELDDQGNPKIFYDDAALAGSTSDTDNYKLGKLESGIYTYYYFDFTARYGDDLSEKWPIGILAPLKVAEKHSGHKCLYLDSDGKQFYRNLKSQKETDQGSIEDGTKDYEYAYFSAWNGEYKVKYTQDNLNGNQTIKGRYMILDEALLHDGKFDSNFENSNLISFLGFWDNGADVEWSVPKLFQYNLMLQVPSTTKIDETAKTVTENGVVLDTNKVAIIADDRLPPEDTIPEGARIFRKYEGKWYELDQSFRTFDDSIITNQTATHINGFTFKERKHYRHETGYKSVTGELLYDAYDAYFYYDRNSYTLTYFNYENIITSYYVEYDAALTEEEYDKRFDKYPPSLEPDAYEFAGWYTSALRINPINFATAKMPAENIVWYAKWVPVKHDVNFFSTYDDMLAYENDNTAVTPFRSDKDVVHRTIVGSVKSPQRTGDGGIELIFSGWFYMENGEKKAFSPLSMPINKDMNIFADWSSSSPQPYSIQYVLKNNPSEKVAEDTTGFAYAGSTRTFTAKAGNPYNQLYEEYNRGYFPTVSSHSITMQYEEDKHNPQLNVSTFYYVAANNIEYTVRYVNKATNAVMEEKKVVTSDAVITERFKAYADMVPDAFYKRLVLAVEYDEINDTYISSKDNVITFYYTQNTTSAYYAVHFMQEKLDATDEERENFAINGSGGYEENGTLFEGVGDIGSKVPVTPQIFPGFSLLQDNALYVTDGKATKASYDTIKNQYSIEVTPNGAELYIFYKRENYNYNVHYYRYNTTDKIHDSKQGNARYGAQITESAINDVGYRCVSTEVQTITIRDNTVQNEIIFYYEPIQHVAEYVPVPGEGGSLSSTIEVISGNEDLKGSLPTAGINYEFVGWYLDEACTRNADERGRVEADNRFIPDKNKLSADDRNIFYAKFVRRTGDLTIERNNAQDPTQVFVYEIKNNETSEIITVSVVGNASVTITDLPFGDYTVTQKNEWSWRHDDGAMPVRHHDENGTTVPFAKAQINDKWLNGNSDLLLNQRGDNE